MRDDSVRVSHIAPILINIAKPRRIREIFLPTRIWWNRFPLDEAYLDVTESDSVKVVRR